MRACMRACRWENGLNRIIRGLPELTKSNCPWVQDASAVFETYHDMGAVLPSREGCGTRLERIDDAAKRARAYLWARVIAGPVGIIAMEHARAMPAPQRAAFKGLMYVCCLLYSKYFRRADLDQLDVLVVEALHLAWCHLCCTELDIKMHELLHAVERIKHLGPAWTTAMWVFEAMWRTVG